jgi:diguanylate cyclase (GGDEF)-like protein
MKTVREVLRRAPVWVNPEHTVESAIVLMRGHNVDGLPVIDGSRLVGMVTTGDLLGVDPRRIVADAMSHLETSISPDASVREAAEMMLSSGSKRLAVVEDDHLIGVITAGDLLMEVGRNFDPLTGLTWSDALREWAIEQLALGEEITVLFIDLDNFGQFNKSYGHIVGDEVLRSVSATLESLINPEIDFLCRYGGDEFCIASRRHAAQAESLGQEISARVAGLRIPELKGAAITCSFGLYGGKRTREREHVHYAATLNSLINLASRACTANKKRPNGIGRTVISMGSSEAGTRLRLSRIEVRWDHRTAHVQVDMQAGPDSADIDVATPESMSAPLYSASMSGESDVEGVLKLVAETTIAAVKSFLPAGYDLSLTDIVLNQIASGQTIITAVGQFLIEGHAVPLAGSAVLGDDPYRAAASCVLAAINRPLSRVVARQRMGSGAG